MEERIAEQRIAALAELAGHPLPADRIEPAGKVFAVVLSLAETLEGLPFEGVEPALAPGAGCAVPVDDER